MKFIPNPYPSPAPNPQETQSWLDDMEDLDTFDFNEYGPIVSISADGNFYVAIDSWGYDSTCDPPSYDSLNSYMLEIISPLIPKAWQWINAEDQDSEPPVRCELMVTEWEIGPQ